MALAVTTAVHALSMLDALLEICKAIYDFYLEVMDGLQSDNSDLDYVYFDGAYYLNSNHHS